MERRFYLGSINWGRTESMKSTKVPTDRYRSTNFLLGITYSFIFAVLGQVGAADFSNHSQDLVGFRKVCESVNYIAFTPSVVTQFGGNRMRGSPKACTQGAESET
jgi:hypothetical protein